MKYCVRQSPHHTGNQNKCRELPAPHYLAKRERETYHLLIQMRAHLLSLISPTIPLN